jgi:hypothetical protein
VFKPIKNVLKKIPVFAKSKYLYKITYENKKGRKTGKSVIVMQASITSGTSKESRPARKSR